MLKKKYIRLLSWAIGLALLFVLYAIGLSHNPPGFFRDESAVAYNAYLVAHTGAGEFGVRFPLYFQVYTGGIIQYLSPATVYLLGVVFLILPPGILLARLVSAFWVFSACLLMGVLAKRISGRLEIGIIVAATALLTPWFFDVRGVLLEPQFIPLAVTLLLLALYRAQAKDHWNWLDISLIAGALVLVTYCYTSGRVLGPLLAIGFFLLMTNKQRLIDIAKTLLVYGVTFLPIIVFNWQHAGMLTKRLSEVSYIRPEVPLGDIVSEFVRRYLEDQNLTSLLLYGDYHGRHHLQGAGGPIFFATFLLAVFGLLLVLSRRWREPWWRYIVYGLLIAIIPGAITNEPFHQMRLMAYPVFLMILTIPALEWLFATDAHNENPNASKQDKTKEKSSLDLPTFGLARSTRFGILGVVLLATMIQALYFQAIFRTEGPKRRFDFSADYKLAYDAAVAQPVRPIYLEDGYWGPDYVNALWYATVERRPTSEFVHLDGGAKPPSGAIVLSSNETCQKCKMIKSGLGCLLYRTE
jgi:hypothetical protein